MRKVLLFIGFIALLSLIILAPNVFGQVVPPGDEQVYLPVVTRPIDPNSPPPGSLMFLETFDGEPSAPTPWNPPNWDVTVHSRDRDTWYTLEGMQAEHGPNCEGPPNSHYIDQYEDTLYTCRNHMMTAINASGYGLIYFTPDHMVDFSEGTAVIRFDVSTERDSLRDWIDIWITPYDRHLQLPLNDSLPDLVGEPEEGFLIGMDLVRNSFRAYQIHNHQTVDLAGDPWLDYANYFEPSPTRRDTFELRLSRTHMQFGMPDYDIWWVDAEIEPTDWTQAVVQFGHHSYNPYKTCNNDGSCGPGTWHWDNVSIQPAVPFTILPADRRYANQAQPQIQFAEPAPAGSHLRFAGMGELIEFSYDGGATWQQAEVQVQESQTDGSYMSYWTPIPAGVTQVEFRGEDWWAGEWQARDISVWSLEHASARESFLDKFGKLFP